MPTIRRSPLRRSYRRRPGAVLTDLQLAVLCLMVLGKRPAEIGATLGLRREAVGAHMLRLRTELGAETNAHAVALAFCRGLIPRAVQQAVWPEEAA